MLFVVFIAVGCAIAVGQHGESAVSYPAVRLGLVIATTLIHGGALWLFAKMGEDVDTGDPVPGGQERLFTWIEWSVSALFTLHVIYILKWPSLVRFNWGLRSWILVDELLILLPFILPWLMRWAMTDRADWTSQPAAGRFQSTMHRARMVLGLGLTPVLTVCLAGDVANWIHPGILETRYAAFIHAIPLAWLLLFYPSLLRLIWKTTPLAPGGLRAKLERMAHREGIAIREFLVWETGGRLTNAALSGVLPGSRYVFLTDGLLEQFDDNEVLAVFAHELGHAAKGHVRKRIQALLLPLATTVVLAAIVGGAISSPDTIRMESASQSFPSYSSIASAGLLLAFLVYLVVGLGFYSRLLELEADWCACSLLRRAGMEDPLSHYLTVLSQLTRDLPNQGAGWLHPGWKTRQRSLVRAFRGHLPVPARFARPREVFDRFSSGMLVLAALVLTASSLLP